MYENKADDTIVVITHSQMINQLFRSFMKLKVDSDVVLHTGEAGINEWIVNGDKKFITMCGYYHV